MSFKPLLIRLRDKFFKTFIAAAVALKVIEVDQVTKESILMLYEHGKEHISINEFLNFIMVYNQGISFGMFGAFEYSNTIFLVINSIVILCLAIWFKFNYTYNHAFAVGFIFGGAIGNLIDRYRFSAVIDFIDFHYMNLHYPTFNFADVAIVIGIALIISAPFLEKVKFTKGNNN